MSVLPTYLDVCIYSEYIESNCIHVYDLHLSVYVRRYILKFSICFYGKLKKPKTENFPVKHTPGHLQFQDISSLAEVRDADDVGLGQRFSYCFVLLLVGEGTKIIFPV